MAEGNPISSRRSSVATAIFTCSARPNAIPTNQVDLRYAPPVAPVEDFLALAGKLGIGRFVFVQPSAYGRDNRCMLDAMRKIGAAKCRGIVDIDENAPDAELERLDALGVRGVRINVSPVKPFEAGFARSSCLASSACAARCAESAGSSIS